MQFLISCIEAPPGRTYRQLVSAMGNDDALNHLRTDLYTPNVPVAGGGSDAAPRHRKDIKVFRRNRGEQKGGGVLAQPR